MRADELLGIEVGDDPTRTRYELATHLVRPDGALYGGTALAASLEAIELATGRRSVYCTTQFSASAPAGAVIDQTVEVLAEGRNVCQVRLSASTEGRLIYSALGATANPRKGDVGALVGTGPQMPDVAPPSEATPLPWRFEAPEQGWQLAGELVEVPYPAHPVTGEDQHGRVAMWARLRSGDPRHTPATIAFLADMVPISLGRLAQVMGGGTSLDNSLRIGRLAASEWLLLDIEGQLVQDGYGYGHAHVWTQDGQLLATASQSSPLMIWPGGFPAR